MTKIFCPVPGCNASTFPSTAHPTQQHLNRHLLRRHKLKVTASNIIHYRRKQNEAYQKRRALVSLDRSRAVKKMKEQFDAFAKDPSLPLPDEGVGEEVERAYVEMMDVESDSDRAEEELLRSSPAKMGRRRTSAGGRSEWFGKGADYDVSLRAKHGGEDLLTEEEREAALTESLMKLQRGGREGEREAPIDEKMEGVQK